MTTAGPNACAAAGFAHAVPALRFVASAPSRAPALLVGACIGDALAAPVDGLSHQNVRFYYRGIKAYVDHEHGDTRAGGGTARTATLLARLDGNADAVDAERLSPTDRALVDATVAAATGRSTGDAPLAAAHAAALGLALGCPSPDAFDAAAFVRSVVGAAPEALRAPLGDVLARRVAFPLDLHDAATAAFPSDSALAAWAFAVAMFARAPGLVEATLLSAINAGGAAATTGFALGALLGALHGADAFPLDWTDGLAVRGRLPS